MISVKEYQRLKDEVDTKQREADRASGAFDEAVKKLKSEFGVENIEEAKELLAKLEKQETEAAEAFDKKLKEFEDEFGHLFSDR